MATKKTAQKPVEQKEQETMNTTIEQQPTTEQAPESTPAKKQPASRKPLEEVILKQETEPTIWQFTQLCHFVEWRMKAGQPKDQAFQQVIDLTTYFMNGILANWEANGGKLEDATVRYFTARNHPTLLKKTEKKDQAAS